MFSNHNRSRKDINILIVIVECIIEMMDTIVTTRVTLSRARLAIIPNSGTSVRHTPAFHKNRWLYNKDFITTNT